MSVYKDEKRNSWYVKFRYVDYYGVRNRQQSADSKQKEKQVIGKQQKNLKGILIWI